MAAYMFFFGVLCLLCGWSTEALFSPSGPSRLIPLRMSPVTGGRKGSAGEFFFVEPNYNFAVGSWAATALSLKLAIPLAVPLAALAAILTRQTPRVAFGFDKEAMEVFIKQADGSLGSRENFAVGGQNRWRYKSFIKWSFFPNRSLPLFMYFYESQTDPSKPDGTFHLFPVIMDAAQLEKVLLEKVGKKP